MKQINAALSKIRHYVDIKTLKLNIMPFLSHTYLILHCFRLKIYHLKDCMIYKKSLRLMFFLNRNPHIGPLFKNAKILEFSDQSSAHLRIKY